MFDAPAHQEVRHDDEPTADDALPYRPLYHDVGALDVQVQVDDEQWHRKAVGGLETACGLTINYARILGIRSESYLGKLCEIGCFSHHELDVLAVRARERDRHHTDRELKAIEDDRKKFFDRLRDERKPRK